MHEERWPFFKPWSDRNSCYQAAMRIIRLPDQKPFCSWVNKAKRCRYLVPPILFDDVLVASDVDKAHRFNEYFSSAFTIEDFLALLIPSM